MTGRTAADRLGGKSQRLVLFLGLLLATLAAVLVFVIANSSDGGGGGADKVAVVTANEAIPAQTRITADMLKVDFVPADEALPGAFANRSQLVDRVTSQEVAAGAQVQADMVSSSAGEGVTFVVPPGYRAIGVTVSEVVTAGGNLKPGDRVDVVGIFEVEDVESANNILQVLGLDYRVADPPRPAPTGTEGEAGQEDSGRLVLTLTMLQNVKLLALAQEITESTAGGDGADDPQDFDTDPRAATATLELTPQQAQELTWADQFGILRMDARAVGDDEISDVVPTLFRIERLR